MVVLSNSLLRRQINPPAVRLPEPIVRIELEEAAFCTLDWGNSELMAAGLANGTPYHRVYDI
jgi:transcription factor C subunit 6